MTSKIDFKKELEQRAKEIEPIAGTDKSPVKPLKPKEVLPALIIMIILTAIWGIITITWYPKFIAGG